MKNVVSENFFRNDKLLTFFIKWKFALLPLHCEKIVKNASNQINLEIIQIANWNQL